MRLLKTNTATRITVGPFLDKTDGITPEVALTVTSEKLTLMVDTGGVPTLVLDVAPTASGGANDMVHVTNDDAGFYDLELAAADVNYVGRAILALTDAATHCPVFHEFMILPAVVYDSLVGGTDTLTVDVTQWNGTAVPSTEAGASGTIRTGTAGGIAAQSITLAAEAAPGLNFFAGCFVEILTATAGAGQTRGVTSSTNANPPVLTLDSVWSTTPSGTITYRVFTGAPATTADANVVQISGDAAAADNAESFFDGTGYVGGSIRLAVDTVAVSGDTTAADNAEAFFDGTGYAGTGNVIPTVTDVTTKTGYRLSATGVADILTTALTESYAADGAAGTLSQILFGLQAFLQEKAISGTTLTVKKLDGSTTAMTFTLNDATTPTSVTRAS